MKGEAYLESSVAEVTFADETYLDKTCSSLGSVENLLGSVGSYHNSGYGVAGYNN